MLTYSQCIVVAKMILLLYNYCYVINYKLFGFSVMITEDHSIQTLHSSKVKSQLFILFYLLTQ